jgi:hypothetical protein
MDSGSVTARLVDERGKPIGGGVLRVPNGEYVKYDDRGFAWMSRHISDESGVVQLSGLPPGRIELEAEAFGREVVSVLAIIASFGDTGIGDIVLSPALGTVKVVLINVKDGVDYNVRMVQPKPFGSFVGPRLPVHEGGRVVSGLPVRGYRVGVTVGSHGKVVLSDPVLLTLANCEAEIRIDVSSLDSVSSGAPKRNG